MTKLFSIILFLMASNGPYKQQCLHPNVIRNRKDGYKIPSCMQITPPTTPSKPTDIINITSSPALPITPPTTPPKAQQLLLASLSPRVMENDKPVAGYSFFHAFASNIASADVASLVNSTLSADKFSSEAPVYEVVIASLTHGSSAVPSALPPLLPSNIPLTVPSTYIVVFIFLCFSRNLDTAQRKAKGVLNMKKQQQQRINQARPPRPMTKLFSIILFLMASNGPYKQQCLHPNVIRNRKDGYKIPSCMQITPPTTPSKPTDIINITSSPALPITPPTTPPKAQQLLLASLSPRVMENDKPVAGYSFFHAFASNIASADVASLVNSTLSADKFSSEAPVYEVVIASLTHGSSAVPSALPPLLPSNIPLTVPSTYIVVFIFLCFSRNLDTAQRKAKGVLNMKKNNNKG